jgi:hypothetical protein
MSGPEGALAWACAYEERRQDACPCQSRTKVLLHERLTVCVRASRTGIVCVAASRTKVLLHVAWRRTLVLRCAKRN